MCNQVSVYIPSHESSNDSKSLTTVIKEKQKLDIRSRRKKAKQEETVTLTQFLETHSTTSDSSQNDDLKVLHLAFDCYEIKLIKNSIIARGELIHEPS